MSGEDPLRRAVSLLVGIPATTLAMIVGTSIGFWVALSAENRSPHIPGDRCRSVFSLHRDGAELAGAQSRRLQPADRPPSLVVIAVISLFCWAYFARLTRVWCWICAPVRWSRRHGPSAPPTCGSCGSIFCPIYCPRSSSIGRPTPRQHRGGGNAFVPGCRYSGADAELGKHDRRSTAVLALSGPAVVPGRSRICAVPHRRRLQHVERGLEKRAGSQQQAKLR